MAESVTPRFIAFNDSDFRLHDEAAFNAGWDALLSEIREVAVKAEAEWHANGLETICSLDCLIDMRLREHLRELVREGE
jgi:hypothetical protein